MVLFYLFIQYYAVLNYFLHLFTFFLHLYILYIKFQAF